MLCFRYSLIHGCYRLEGKLYCLLYFPRLHRIYCSYFNMWISSFAYILSFFYTLHKKPG
nr:MAG TPA: hypothetical protein [Caudoviricetes sp.]